jgi:hypothetical protein
VARCTRGATSRSLSTYLFSSAYQHNVKAGLAGESANGSAAPQRRRVMYRHVG